MDEPTSGASAKDTSGITETLVTVPKASWVTAILVEHDTDVVEQYAARVFVFREERVLTNGRQRGPRRPGGADGALRKRGGSSVGAGSGRRGGAAEAHPLVAS